MVSLIRSEALLPAGKSSCQADAKNLPSPAAQDHFPYEIQGQPQPALETPQKIKAGYQ